MARDIVVRVTCDLCQADNAEPLSLLVGGRTLEVDVCPTHLAEYQVALAPFVAVARTAEALASESRRSAGPQRRSTQSRAEAARIREWARSQGLELNHRGRIPLAVLDAYTKSV
jgi:hypothetical protein